MPNNLAEEEVGQWLSPGGQDGPLGQVVLADPTREPELGDRQFRALARVAAELAERQA